MGNIIAHPRLMDEEDISNGDTEYSSSIKFIAASGFNAMLVILTAGSNVTISQQCSEDNTTFYDPVDPDGNALGIVYTNLTASAYIQFPPVIAPYIRFKVTASADSTVTLDHIVSEVP